MSGLEGLAAVSAAAQLVGYSLRIAFAFSQLRDRMREAPERFEYYARQVNQLVVTAQRIQKNQILQTPDVCSYLSATISEAKSAQHILNAFLTDSRKRRYWGVISGSSQRKIIEHLDNLHRTVTDLSLYISSINTTQLEKVQGGVDHLIGIAIGMSHVPKATVVSLTPTYCDDLFLIKTSCRYIQADPHEDPKQGVKASCRWRSP
jgi:hypothetical protein